MTALLCRLNLHVTGPYLTIRKGRYTLTCKRCGKESV